MYIKLKLTNDDNVNLYEKRVQNYNDNCVVSRNWYLLICLSKCKFWQLLFFGLFWTHLLSAWLIIHIVLRIVSQVTEFSFPSIYTLRVNFSTHLLCALSNLKAFSIFNIYHLNSIKIYFGIPFFFLGVAKQNICNLSVLIGWRAMDYNGLFKQTA